MTTPTPRADCQFVEEHLADYLGDELAPADLAAVRSHVAECPSCRQRIEGLADAQDRLASIAVSAPDDVSAAAMPPAVRAAPARSPRRFLTPHALAASILLAFVAGYLVGSPSRTPPPGQGSSTRAPRGAELPRVAREYMHASRALPASNSFAWALVSAARR